MNNRNYIKVTKSKVDAKLDVFIYENDGFKIAYAPALDLMGYGKTVEDAKDSFEVVAEDFFETTIRLGTLKQYLEEHGWSKESRKVEFLSPNAWDIQDNKQLQDIFALDFEKLQGRINNICMGRIAQPMDIAGASWTKLS